MNKSRRDQIEFYIKIASLVIIGLWTVYASTSFFDKKMAELDYINKISSNESLPVADTSMEISAGAGHVFSDKTMCILSGKYIIKNTGKLHFFINEVNFRVYKIPVFSDKDLNNIVNSGTYEILRSRLNPIHIENIPVNEIVGVGNQIERTFLYIIKSEVGYNYAVEANASGGTIYLENSSERGPREFLANDLRHTSGPTMLCPSAVNATPPAPVQ